MNCRPCRERSNWPSKELKTKKRRLRFLKREEEQRLLNELDRNRHEKGMVPPSERTAETQRHMQDSFHGSQCLTTIYPEGIIRPKWAIKQIGCHMLL